MTQEHPAQRRDPGMPNVQRLRTTLGTQNTQDKLTEERRCLRPPRREPQTPAPSSQLLAQQTVLRGTRKSWHDTINQENFSKINKRPNACQWMNNKQ